MRMTLEEVKEYVEQLHKEYEEANSSRFVENELNWNNGHQFEHLLDQAHQQGGEGEGDYYEIVYSIKREGYEEQFLMFCGFYDSWNGVTWEDYDNPQLCEPKEVTRIEYFLIKD